MANFFDPDKVLRVDSLALADLERKEDRHLLIELGQICGPKNVSRDLQDLLCYARDMWPRSLLLQRAGRLQSRPRAVVWPGNEEEICRLVRYAGQRRLALIPFGAGSGVCAGTLPLAGEIVVDLKRLDTHFVLDKESGLVEVGAGMIGEIFERRLNRLGFTCGHFPSSMQCSTVGGWVAARGAGQCSSRYGKIEDLVRGLVLVDGEGKLCEFTWNGPGTWSALPFLIGSEGTLGIVTRVKLLVRPLSPGRWLRGFAFPGIEAGLSAMQKIMQRGLRPTVLRLYDEFDSLLAMGGGGEEESILEPVKEKLSSPLKKLFSVSLPRLLANARLFNILLGLLPAKCLLVVVVEGDDAECSLSAREITRICLGEGAEDRGPDAAQHWLAHRYDISYRQSAVFSSGAFVDTMEVATTWDRLPSLYRDVRRSLSRRVFVMAHFSHAYREGCSVYFTFAGAASDEAHSIALYDRLWDEAQRIVLSHRASVSHHHGVGFSKGRYLVGQLGQGKILLEKIKNVFDPGFIFNPGKLAYGKFVDGLASESIASFVPEKLSLRPLKLSSGKILERVYQPTNRGEIAEIVRQVFGQRRASLLFGSASHLDFDSLDGQLEQCTLISTLRLKNVEEINRRGCYLVAEAGVRLGHLRRLCRQEGLELDQDSNGTLGGWLARSGTLYDPVIGVDVPAVLALEAVLPDGRTVHTVPVPRSATGPDLNALWLGSLGFLGAIVRVWLKLEPLAEEKSELVAEFSALVPALGFMRQLGHGFFPPRRLVAELEKVEGRVNVVLAARFSGEKGLVRQAAERFRSQLKDFGGRLAERDCVWPRLEDGGRWYFWKEILKLAEGDGWEKIRLFGIRPDGCMVVGESQKPALGDLELFRKIKRQLDPELLFNRPLWHLLRGEP